MHDEEREFPATIQGLPEASRPVLVELADGDSLISRSLPSASRSATRTSGCLRATDRYGLRLESRFDGTPGTQAPITIGETFAYELAFPDPGRG